MKPIVEKAKKIMKIKLASQPHIIDHTEKVTRKALEIGKRLKDKGYDVDLELLRAGGYLHDVGRSVTHDARHGVEGGRIVKESGFSEPVVKLVERHIGAGIPADEAVKLGLPRKDYIPETIEEKILAYADKFLESELVFKTANGEQIVERRNVECDSIEPTLNKFRKIFGHKNPVVLRLERLRDEMESLLE